MAATKSLHLGSLAATAWLLECAISAFTLAQKDSEPRTVGSDGNGGGASSGASFTGMMYLTNGGCARAADAQV